MAGVINTATPQPSSTITPFVSKTRTCIPSLTPAPTKTPTLVPTLNPTEKAVATIVEATSVVKATQSAVLQVEIQTAQKISGNDCETSRVKLSPDEKWMARDCGRDDGFRVSSSDGTKLFVISYSDVSDLLGFTSSDTWYVDNIYPLHWTEDGRFLFFSEYICCVDTDAFGWDDDLFRLNLITGEWSRLINGTANYYDFSPAGEKMIYIPFDRSGFGQPVIINILDLETWSQNQILLQDYEQAGSVVWSPDEKSIVLVAKTGNIYDGNQKYSIVIMDLVTDSYKVISYPYHIYPVSWSENNVITLISVSCAKDNPYSCYDVFLFYDLNIEGFVYAP